MLHFVCRSNPFLTGVIWEMMQAKFPSPRHPPSAPTKNIPMIKSPHPTVAAEVWAGSALF
jgi:hypothetical protein